VDQESFELVSGLLHERLDRIEALLPFGAPRRGQRLIDLVKVVCDGLRGEHGRIATAFSGAATDERRVLGRKLTRLLQQSHILNMLKPYVDDVGRRDVPVGVWQMIDMLVESLLPGGADPVIHYDDQDMYSTADLVTAIQGTLSALGVTYGDPVHPIIFFLPGTDPSNALLMPILAHEVGHAAVEDSHLGSATLKNVTQIEQLNALLDECLKAAGDPSPGPWQFQFFQWVDELLCDALATVLTGPSLLFASATFLPAPDPGTLGTHPFPADRIRFTLEQLHRLGWTSILEGCAPKTKAWLERLTAPATGEPKERFLRGAIEIVKPALFDVAEHHATRVFKPDDFNLVSSELTRIIEAGVPPAQVNGHSVDPWSITLAGWLYQFRVRGDAPKTLAEAAADRDFNALVHKAIEMSRIVRLWEES